MSYQDRHSTSVMVTKGIKDNEENEIISLTNYSSNYSHVQINKVTGSSTPGVLQGTSDRLQPENCNGNNRQSISQKNTIYRIGFQILTVTTGVVEKHVQ